MKKVQIISKDGKKIEVYYLSNHPMNKFVPPQNAEIEEEEMASQRKVQENINKHSKLFSKNGNA